MAKSMKVPVLVFENIKETEILLEGLNLVTAIGHSHKRKVIDELTKEIQNANSSMAMMNNN